MQQNDEKQLSEPIMNDENNDNQPSDDQPEGYWDQGLHHGTFRKIMREQYDCELVEHVERFLGEDGKWYDRWYSPIELEEVQSRHLNKVEEELFENGKPIGLHFVVRNYHYKYRKEHPSKYVHKEREKKQKVVLTEEDRKIMAAMRYQENKEKLKSYARQRYYKLRNNPEWVKKHRDHCRENYREKHYISPASEETIRRNEVRRNYAESVRLEAEGIEERIAELMQRDDEGTITELEILELEDLLNGEDGKEGTDRGIMPELSNDNDSGPEPDGS